MNREHYLIVVPGLGGENSGLKTIVDSWNKYGVGAIVHDVHWRDNGNEIFELKLKRLVGEIDGLKKKGRVSLLGTSAGGSAVMNAFSKRRGDIYKVINVCGRLREGINVHPTLEVAAKTSPSFKESVLLCEKVQQNFTEEDRKKILTIRSLFDEIVPISTMAIFGARNDQILSVGHVFSIVLAITIYSKRIVNFLNS